MPTDRIAIRLVGLPEDEGDVRVVAFTKKLNALLSSLRATEKTVSEQSGTFDYRVVDLSHSSPSTVEVEVIALDEEAMELRDDLTENFYRTAQAINAGGDIPAEFSYGDLQKFKDLEPRKKDVPEVSLFFGNQSLKLAIDWSDKIEELLGPDQFEIGSVVGRLEQINVHGNNRTFHVYPTFDEPAVKCEFEERHREQIVQALDKYVEIFGTLTYKARSQFPHHISVDRIEIFLKESQLPTLDDFSGVAPNITEGKTIEDYLQEVRRGW